MYIRNTLIAALSCIMTGTFFFYFTDTRLEGEIMWQLSKKHYGYKIYRSFYGNRVKEIEEAITENFSFDDYTIEAEWEKDTILSDIPSQFFFNNETCSDIVNLHHDRYPIPSHGKDWFMAHYTDSYPLIEECSPSNNYELTCSSDSFQVLSDSLDNHWIYIVSKDVMPKKYAVEFDYESRTAIKEQLQFCVYTSSLADRFRIISDYGETVFFNAVQKGYFLKKFNEKECKIPVNETTNIRLEVDRKHIVFFVNGEKKMCVSVNDYPNKPGHLIILFWNDKDKVPIDITVSNFAIYTDNRLQKNN